MIHWENPAREYEVLTGKLGYVSYPMRKLRKGDVVRVKVNGQLVFKEGSHKVQEYMVTYHYEDIGGNYKVTLEEIL